MKELDNKKRNKYITSMGKNIQFIKLEKEIKELILKNLGRNVYRELFVEKDKTSYSGYMGMTAIKRASA